MKAFPTSSDRHLNCNQTASGLPHCPSSCSDKRCIGCVIVGLVSHRCLYVGLAGLLYSPVLTSSIISSLFNYLLLFPRLYKHSSVFLFSSQYVPPSLLFLFSTKSKGFLFYLLWSLSLRCSLSLIGFIFFVFLHFKKFCLSLSFLVVYTSRPYDSPYFLLFYYSHRTC